MPRWFAQADRLGDLTRLLMPLGFVRNFDLILRRFSKPFSSHRKRMSVGGCRDEVAEQGEVGEEFVVGADEKQAQEIPQVFEDEPQVEGGCGEERVDFVAGDAEEVVSAEPAIVFGVADHGFDGGSALEFAPHGGGEAAFAACDHDFGVAVIVVAAIAAINVSALDGRACYGLGLAKCGGKGAAIVRVALERLRGEEETLAVGGGDADFRPEFVTFVRFALGDADHLGRVKRIELVLVRRLLLKKPR